MSEDPRWLESVISIGVNCAVNGWDSYAAKPVSGFALGATKRLCESLDVSPKSDGGVEVYLASEGIAIEIDRDGCLESILYDVKQTADYLAAGRNQHSQSKASETDKGTSDGCE